MPGFGYGSRSALDKPEEGFSVTAVSGWRLVRELDRARRILDAAKENPGVFAFEGQMVDEPLLRQARATLGR